MLLGWYPRTKLEMDEERRTREAQQVRRRRSTSTPREVMREMRTWFTDALAERLPGAPLLYWT